MHWSKGKGPRAVGPKGKGQGAKGKGTNGQGKGKGNAGWCHRGVSAVLARCGCVTYRLATGRAGLERPNVDMCSLTIWPRDQWRQLSLSSFSVGIWLTMLSRYKWHSPGESLVALRPSPYMWVQIPRFIIPFANMWRELVMRSSPSSRTVLSTVLTQFSPHISQGNAKSSRLKKFKDN